MGLSLAYEDNRRASNMRCFPDSDSSYVDTKETLYTWNQHTAHADRATHHECEGTVQEPSTHQGWQGVFNIAGNKYRVAVWINARTV